MRITSIKFGRRGENKRILFSCTVKPLWVRLQGEERPLSAGTSYEIACEVVGARPTPEIVWTKGNTILRSTSQSVRIFLSVLASVTVFLSSIEHQILSSSNGLTTELVYSFSGEVSMTRKFFFQ